MGSLDVALAPLFAAQLGLVTRSQVVARRTRRAIEYRTQCGAWIIAAPLVYRLASAPCGAEQRLLAALLSVGEPAAAFGTTAAALHVLPGFDLAPLRICVPDPARVRGLSVKVHRSSQLPSHHRTMVGPIPVTTVARTLFDLCRSIHPLRAERTLDTALARGLVRADQCLEVLADLAGSGRNGVTLWRGLLDDRGEGYTASESELEDLFEKVIRNAGLPMPTRQVSVGTQTAWVGRVDYVYTDRGLPLEVDSRRHHTALVDYEHDLGRDNALVADGQTPPLRITHRMLTRNPDHVVAMAARRALETHPPTTFPGR